MIILFMFGFFKISKLLMISAVYVEFLISATVTVLFFNVVNSVLEFVAVLR